MTISLVTGGAGFIGSHVVKRLLAMGHQVIVLDHLEGGNIANITDVVRTIYSCYLDRVGWYDKEDENCAFVKGSICSRDTVDGVFAKWKPDYVFHFAAYAAEGLSHFIRHYNYEVNVLGSVNLINASIRHKVKRFVFASSAAVYGERESASERDGTYPLDPYGIAKLAVEQDLWTAWNHFGLPFTIFRMHNVYGPGQNINDPYRNVIGIFMKQCLLGQPMTIFGDGHQSRSFTYIDDVAPYIARCIDMDQTRNATINIGADKFYRVLNLAPAVAQAVGVETQIAHLPERHEAFHISLDHALFKHLFLPIPPVTLDEGLARMATWAKTQKLEPSKPFANIELHEGLPESWRVISEH